MKTKLNSDGNIERRKARLVARGFSQKPGIDFTETVAPVVRSSTIRLMMALSVELGLKVHQMNVVTAYLNGEVEEDLYMKLPNCSEEVLKEIIAKNEKGKEEIISTAKKWLVELQKGNTAFTIKQSTD